MVRRLRCWPGGWGWWNVRVCPGGEGVDVWVERWRRRAAGCGETMRPTSEGVGRSFFFFQAEDGIRDRTVTGVQTCALPIFRDWRHETSSTYLHALDVALANGGNRVFLDFEEGELTFGDLDRRSTCLAHELAARSEERRGGEEGRSRGVPLAV